MTDGGSADGTFIYGGRGVRTGPGTVREAGPASAWRSHGPVTSRTVEPASAFL